MQKLAKNGTSETDHCHVIAKGDSLPSIQSEASKYLVHVSDYTSELTDSPCVGIWLDSDDNIHSITDDAMEKPVIAINFPVFTDGRGFSLAQQLRTELNYTGELRAIGHFMEEQLFYLKRCGFDSFVVEDDSDISALQKILNDFSNNYQGSAEEPTPLYRRRL